MIPKRRGAIMPEVPGRRFRTRGATGAFRSVDATAPPSPSTGPDELVGEWLEDDEEDSGPVASTALSEGGPLRTLAVPLPASVYERAKLLAEAAGYGSVEGFASVLLREAIEARGHSIAIRPDREIVGSDLIVLDDDASEPETVAPRIDWGDSLSSQDVPSVPEVLADELEPPMTDDQGAAAQTVLRHATGTGPEDFLAVLRRGEPVGPGTVQELLDALRELERRFAGRETLDRKLAFALHRLAFEGQVLVTDAWDRAADPRTVAMLRVVQEGVDRVLSGEDVRYDRLA